MKRNSLAVELVAVPYDTSAYPFHFTSIEEYEAKFEERYRRSRVEEYEIQFIDGDGIAQGLFDGMDVTQVSIGAYFDALELGADEQRGMVILMDVLGMEPNAARERASDVYLFEGSKGDYVAELLDDVGISDELAEQYFGYDSWGYDYRISGDALNSLEEDLATYEEESNSEEAERLREEIERIEGLSDEELAYDYIESIGTLKDAVGAEAMARYFDYSAFARDMDINGELSEVRVGGLDYVFTNPLEF